MPNQKINSLYRVGAVAVAAGVLFAYKSYVSANSLISQVSTLPPQEEIPDEDKYTFMRRLDGDELGRHKKAEIVSWSSSNTTKFGVQKGLDDANLPHDWYISPVLQFINSMFVMIFDASYGLPEATREVFFGRLAYEIFEGDSPDTRFNQKKRATISEIIGGNAKTSVDLYRFASMFTRNGDIPSNIPDHVHISLLNAILYARIIGDSDVYPKNLIARFESLNGLPTATLIYGIDHEYAAHEVNGWFTYLIRILYRRDLRDLLSSFYSDPQRIINGIFNGRPSIYSAYHDYIMSRLSIKPEYITQELFIQSLRRIVDSISTQDFQVCHATKRYIIEKLRTKGSVYREDEIKYTVIPIIDSCIEVLKENIAVVREFMQGLESEARMPAPKL